MACCAVGIFGEAQSFQMRDTRLPPFPMLLMVEAHLLIVSFSPNADSESIAMGA
jgi:hypothetical protein